MLLHHVMGDIEGNRGKWYYVKGGNGALSAYLAKLAEERKVEICLNAPVDSIIVEGERGSKTATGVMVGKWEG